MKEEQMAYDLLACHALSGCDTVACYFGISKVKALKTLRAGFSLSCLGNIHASFPDVRKQATEFVGACYGHKHHTSMSEARKMSWAAKVGKGSTSTPYLNNLSPTIEAFIENVKRAHIQACVWKHALHSAPPLIDPLNNGVILDTSTKSLLPISLPEAIPLAPENILKLIRCSCETDTPCKTMRCRCASAKLPCTVFCHCHADACYNQLPKSKGDDENASDEIDI